jgi:hypothetical protein
MRIFSRTMLLPTLLLVAASLVRGEILDRIVAVMDDRFVITLSDVRKERAIQSAFGRDAGSDEAILDALIERHLVDKEIDQFREIDVPEDAVADRLRSLQVPQGTSREDLRSALVGEYRRNQFMIERFQQFIRVSDEELRKYYTDVYTPEVQRRGEPLRPFEEVAEAIRRNRILEKMNEEVTT